MQKGRAKELNAAAFDPELLKRINETNKPKAGFIRKRTIIAILAMIVAVVTVYSLAIPGLSFTAKGRGTKTVPTIPMRGEDVVPTRSTDEEAYYLALTGDVGVTSNLDGKTFIITCKKSNLDYYYALTNTNTPGDNGYTWMKHCRTWERLDRMVSDAPISTFTFHAITEPDPDLPNVTQDVLNRNNTSTLSTYMVTTEVNGETMYLHIDGSNLFVSSDKAVVRVNKKSGIGDRILIQSLIRGSGSTAYSMNLKGNGNRGVYQGYGTENDVNNYLTLIEARPIDVTVYNEQNVADKVSVTDLVDNDKVVVYRSVWDPVRQQYELFAIDGYGNLVPVTDEDSQLGWYTFDDPDHKYTSTVEWEFTIGRNTDDSENGYYWLKNTVTGAYLAPRAHYDYDNNRTEVVILDGTGIEAGTSSSFDYSMQLLGRRDGNFDSTIVSWTYMDGTCALYYKEDDAGLLGYVLEMGGYEDADRFNFARVVPNEDLTTVPTLNSTAMGIAIEMFDYPSREWMRDVIGSDLINVSTNNRQDFVPYLVEPVLSANGLPISNVNGNELDELFTGGTPANHLFLASAYSETGYFQYSSGDNYAYYVSDPSDPNYGNFIVYNQLGAPTTNQAAHREHGHFMPYSRLLEQIWTETNCKNEYLQDLPIDDPLYGTAIHRIEMSNPTSSNYLNQYNYNFGMTVEVDFLQMYNKRDRYGNDLIFEFSGDDDVWLYVDDVLVLDLGGIHAAVHGLVNFTTGQITYTGFNPKSYDNQSVSVPTPPSTIKECFRKAGVFPDGSTWDDSLVDQYFDGDTFKSDFFGHRFKFFYMERGKNASNLKMRFNLTAVKRDSFVVTKELTGTDKQEFSDKTFMFQAFKDDGTPLTNAKVAVSDNSGAWIETEDNLVFYNNVVIGNQTYNNVFKLKGGEGAYFALSDSDSYYVREIGIDPAEVTDVTVNFGSETLTVTPNDGDASLDDYATGITTPRRRRQVNYANECETQDLRITKDVELHGQTIDPNTTFEFRLWLAPDQASLEHYSVKPYYMVKTENGVDTYYYRINGKMTPLVLGVDGKYYYDNNGTLTVIPKKNPHDPIFDYSSQTGYISYVPAGFTVIIKDLLPGTTFGVTETSIPQGYTLRSLEDEENTSFITLSSPGDTRLDGEIRFGDDAKVLCTNLYAEGNFRLKKISAENAATVLEGAEFYLYGATPDYVGGAFRFYRSDIIAKLRSGADGLLYVLPNEDTGEGYYGADVGDTDLKLASGTYYLFESVAPDGYSRVNPTICFTVSHSGDLTILGPIYWDSANDCIGYISRSNMGVVSDTTIGGVTLQTGTLSNIPAVYLPATGGEGVNVFYVTGGAMIALSLTALLIINGIAARRRRKAKDGADPPARDRGGGTVSARQANAPPGSPPREKRKRFPPGRDAPRGRGAPPGKVFPPGWDKTVTGLLRGRDSPQKRVFPPGRDAPQGRVFPPGRASPGTWVFPPGTDPPRTAAPPGRASPFTRSVFPRAGAPVPDG